MEEEEGQIISRINLGRGKALPLFLLLCFSQKHNSRHIFTDISTVESGSLIWALTHNTSIGRTHHFIAVCTVHGNAHPYGDIVTFDDIKYRFMHTTCNYQDISPCNPPGQLQSSHVLTKKIITHLFLTYLYHFTPSALQQLAANSLCSVMTQFKYFLVCSRSPISDKEKEMEEELFRQQTPRSQYLELVDACDHQSISFLHWDPHNIIATMRSTPSQEVSLLCDPYLAVGLVSNVGCISKRSLK